MVQVRGHLRHFVVDEHLVDAPLDLAGEAVGAAERPMPQRRQRQGADHAESAARRCVAIAGARRTRPQ